MFIENDIEKLLEAPSTSPTEPISMLAQAPHSEKPDIFTSLKDAFTGLGKDLAKVLGGITLAAAIAAPAVGLMPAVAQAGEKNRPNILFILADNQAPSTLGCYGNKEISTPNIDLLASQGMKFRNAVACNGLCSPTKASILTGLLPSQHGVHTALDDRSVSEWPEGWCAINEFPSLPQTLSDAGYDTALIGKYHLGIPFEPALKFDYWVTFPQGDTLSFYDNTIIDNGRTYKEPGHVVDLWTKKAVEYINNRKGDKPFFLYLAYDGPYGLPPAISGTPKNRYAKLYVGKEMKSSPQLPINEFLRNATFTFNPKTDDVNYSAWRFIAALNDQETMRNYASQIILVDDSVGTVLDALKKNGLDHNTLVIYNADQGLIYGQHGIWGQSFITFPSTVYRDEVNVPLIVRHTNHIDALQETDLLVNSYDFMPTILDYVGLGDKEIANTPGTSFAPLLKGQKFDSKQRDAIFIDQEQTRAIVTHKWKYIKRFPKLGLEELFDLKNDPGELVNLADDPKYADIKTELDKCLTAFFDKYADPKYDLWKGGVCKATSWLEPLWKEVNPNFKVVVEKVEHPFTDK